MSLLLIDRALPSSVYSGKTVRLKQIYGRLAKEIPVIYLRTAGEGEEDESPELEKWARDTFQGVLRMPALPRPSLVNRLNTLLGLKPWYDLFSKHPREVKFVGEFLQKAARELGVTAVVTFDLEAAPYGVLLSKFYPWFQDLGDSMRLWVERRWEDASSFKDHCSLALRALRENDFEEEMVRRAQATLFVSEEDASPYRSLGHKVYVVPNGVDSDYFDPAQAAPFEGDHPYLVFTGHMSFLPNQHAAEYFAEEIFPMLRAEFPELGFKIVGADPAERVRRLQNLPGVEVTGRVDDLRPYLAGALAFVCPMRLGSGMKNKLLEAMSMRLPVVASRRAVAGIPDVPEAWIEVADDPGAFARKVMEILKDPRKAANQGKQAREFVRTRYSWNQTLEQYRRIILPGKEALLR